MFHGLKFPKYNNKKKKSRNPKVKNEKRSTQKCCGLIFVFP